MFPNNPIFTEMMVKMRQEEIRYEIECNNKIPVPKSKSEVWFLIILLIVLVWFLM